MHNIQHQLKHNTHLNRYPDIFSFCQKENPNAKKIVSFGCSSGEEIESLNRIFENSIFYGVEIDDELKEKCEIRFKDNERVFISKNIIQDTYDMIFCMSVFCKWPDTKSLNDCSEIYPFSFFEKTIQEIDKFINIGGLLIIYNSNFKFEDCSVASNYISIGNFEESGYVKKFNKNNKEDNNTYNKCVFKKQNYFKSI